MAADMRSIICCHKQNWSAIVAEVAVVERASGGSDAAGQPEVSDLSGSKFGEAADGSGGNEIRMKRRSEWYPSLSAPHLPATAGQPVVKLPRARSLIHTLSGPVPGLKAELRAQMVRTKRTFTETSDSDWAAMGAEWIAKLRRYKRLKTGLAERDM